MVNNPFNARDVWRHDRFYNLVCLGFPIWQKVAILLFLSFWQVLFFQLPEILERNIFWINMLGYMHAMINPVIYITLNEKFRQEFAKTVFFGKTASTESGSYVLILKITRILNSSNFSQTPLWLKETQIHRPTPYAQGIHREGMSQHL